MWFTVWWTLENWIPPKTIGDNRRWSSAQKTDGLWGRCYCIIKMHQRDHKSFTNYTPCSKTSCILPGHLMHVLKLSKCFMIITITVIFLAASICNLYLSGLFTFIRVILSGWFMKVQVKRLICPALYCSKGLFRCYWWVCRDASFMSLLLTKLL